MFSLFWPNCPVDAREKAWIETRLMWMCQQFGVNRLVDAEMLLPSDERLSALNGSEDVVRPVFNFLCDRMQLDPAKVELEFVPDDEIPNAAGVYSDEEAIPRIQIAQSQLNDAHCLVATLIHELSHNLFLGQGILTKDVIDHEQTTDLHAVFRGLGIFAANATVVETHERLGRWHSWNVGKQGYLTSREYGYALAVFAWIRQEARPIWRDMLRLDARSAFDDGLRHLRKRRDCLMDDGNATSLDTKQTPLVLEGLKSRFDATRVATLWSISRLLLNSPEIVESVADQLCHKNPILRQESAATLGALGSANPRVIERLVDRLTDRQPMVRAAAAKSLGAIRPSAAIVIPELRFLLEDPEWEVVESALECARQFGSDAAPLIPKMLPVLKNALVDCNYTMCDLAMSAVAAADANWKSVIREYFEADEDLLSAVESLMSDRENEAASPVP